MNKHVNFLFPLLCSGFIAILCLGMYQPVQAQINFTEMRTALLNRHTGMPYNENSGIVKDRLRKTGNSATSLWNSMIKTGERTTLWSDLDFATAADMTESYERLQSLAMATVLPGCIYYNDAALKADIISGLEWMYDNYYNENSDMGTEWWVFRVGVPLRLNNAVLFLYDDLSEEQRTKFMEAVKAHCNDIAHYTAANLAWILHIIAVRAILVEDEERLLYARNELIPSLVNVTIGDGFYDDGSFIQHTRHPYNGGYGISFLTTAIQVMQIFAGTVHDFPQEYKDRVAQWIFDGYEPLLFKGALFAFVRGREISRVGTSDNGRGRGIAQILIRFRDMVDEESRARINSLIKYLLTTDDTFNGPYEGITDINALVEIEKIVTDTSIQPKSNYEIYHQYVNMDRVVQQRPKYAFGVAMHSTRIYNFEMTNNENLKGWFTAAGTTYLYTHEGGQYAQSYWPTVDAYKMAGTTVPEQRIYGRNQTTSGDFVGGVEFKKMYGVTAMDYDVRDKIGLKAKKSWFMFDDEIVALGSDIVTSYPSDKINTYIDQRRLSSDNRNSFSVNGVNQSGTFGEDEPVTLENVSWAYLTGKYSTTEPCIGYYFPTPLNLKATRKMNYGTWRDVNITGSTTEQSNYFLTMWKEHNTPLQNTESESNKYEYVILPAKSSGDVRKYAEKPDIEIIENSARIHAVREKTLGITGVVFWEEDATQKVSLTDDSYVHCDKKATIMVQLKTDHVTLSISDPTQLNSGIAKVILQNVQAISVPESSDNIKVVSLSPSVELEVDMTDSKGYTSEITLLTSGTSITENDLSSFSCFAGISGEKLYVHLFTDRESPVLSTMYDLQGKVVYQDTLSAKQGFNEYQFDVERWTANSYIITIQQEDNVFKQKLIK